LADDALRILALELVNRGDVDVELPVFVGPTATGKTALASYVAEAIGGEIVNVDSVQIYRDFDIGSGKPSPAELARAPHHLLSIRDPNADLDAHAFACLADAAILDIRNRGRRPILVGGTFLWVRAVLAGLAEAPRGNADLRSAHEGFALEHGRAALHERLRDVDPVLFAKLHPNDFIRVSRALEVFELTGKPLSAFQAEHQFSQPRYAARMFAIALSEPVHTANVRARVADFFARGWREEVLALRAAGYASSRAMGSVGYRELNDEADGVKFPDSVEEHIVRATRVFARRQRTWLNQMPVTWLTPQK
jgi:tRNA dimethylallyltransferase